MEYTLLIYADQAAFEAISPAQAKEAQAAYRAYTEALQEAGVLRGANRLRPTHDGDHRARCATARPRC